MNRLRLPAGMRWSLVAAFLVSACNCGDSTLKPVSTNLSLDPGTIDFGLQRIGHVVERKVVIHNRGQVQAVFTKSAESNNPTDFTGPTAPLLVEPDSALEITIAYRPSDEGSDQGVWVFENPADDLKLSLVLLGSGSANACVDDDADGYGEACAKGPDCNDADATVHPGATEVCKNGRDDDCDPSTTDDCTPACAATDCHDDPEDCVRPDACEVTANGPKCSETNLADGTRCRLSAAAVGECRAGSCVQTLTAQPLLVDFGLVPVGTRTVRHVVLSNSGVNAIALTASAPVTPAPVFGGPAVPIDVPAGGDATIEFSFTPTAQQSEGVRWILSDGEGREVSLHLAGSGSHVCTDNDHDGYGPDCAAGADCDDTRASVNPASPETCGNGLDDDCNPATSDVCPPTCTDADHDSYGTNCAAGADCNDGNAAVHPGTPEICGNGIDDDCNPNTPDTCACPFGSCPDTPGSCQVATGCSMQGSTPVCQYGNRPDRTACTMTSGGSGLCSAGSCVQCLAASDCAAPANDYASCALVSCDAGVCNTNWRHDGQGGFLSTPAFGGEMKIGDQGTAAKVFWDGTNFQVAMRLASGNWVRKISPAGTLLNAAPGYPLDSRFADIAAGGGTVFEATVDPAGDPDANYANQHVGRNLRNLDGALLGAHQVAFYDGYETLGRPRVAAADNGFSMIVAQRGTTTTGAVFAPGGGPMAVNFGFTPAWPWRTISPNVVASASGFAVAILDQHYYDGCPEDQCTPPNCAEIWAQRVGFNAAVTSSYGPVVPLPFATSYCTTANQLPGLASGRAGFLVSSGSDVAQTNAETQVRVLDGNFTPGATIPLTGPSALQQGKDIELDFDGSNYVVVNADDPKQQLPGFRLSEAGARLDTGTFDLTPADGIYELEPRIGSNRSGRHVIAYTKYNDSNVYVRLFSTCP